MTMWGRRLLVVVSLLTLIASTCAFIPSTGMRKACNQEKVVCLYAQEPNSSKKKNKYYNDDAFGLIFLSTALVDQDTSFTAAFGILSAICAVAVRQDNGISFRPLLPGLVAVAAAVLTFPPTKVELATVSVSLAWSIFQELQAKKENEK